MDKNTLSNYGWIVIAVLVLSVMIALATPFGSYVKNATESTLTGLFDTSESALNVVGMSAKGDGSSGLGTQTPTEPDAPTDIEPTECQHTNATIINASSATCTTAGYTGDTYCNDCENTIATGESVSATGHQNTIVINASATYTGDTYCNDCNTTFVTGETISQYQLSGTWKFNDSLVLPTNAITQIVDATYWFSGSHSAIGNIEITSSYVYFSNNPEPSYRGDMWHNPLKQVIYFTAANEVSQAFYEWFIVNATQVSTGNEFSSEYYN